MKLYILSNESRSLTWRWLKSRLEEIWILLLLTRIIILAIITTIIASSLIVIKLFSDIL